MALEEEASHANALTTCKEMIGMGKMLDNSTQFKEVGRFSFAEPAPTRNFLCDEIYFCAIGQKSPLMGLLVAL